MLYRISVKFRSNKVARSANAKFVVPTFAEVTMVPTKLGRLFGLRTRRGHARRGKCSNDDGWGWFWTNTDRHVGWRVESYIEAAPIDNVEDMPIELLLGEGESP